MINAEIIILIKIIASPIVSNDILLTEIEEVTQDENLLELYGMEPLFSKQIKQMAIQKLAQIITDLEDRIKILESVVNLI